jgi:uncharacterized protein (DUF58 family)
VHHPSPRRGRAAYARGAPDARGARRRALAAAGVDEIELRTDRDYVEPLLRAFRMRERRTASGR